MAVAHLASSESHGGTTGSTNEGSFPWPHTPGGTPRGVTVFVWTNGNSGLGSLALGVTYDGVTVPEVVGGEATRTTGEQGTMAVYHLGVGVPTASPATVIVTRTNSPATMWACCCTQSGYTDTEVSGLDTVISGVVGLSEQAIDDGSPGFNSVRYGAAHLGYDSVPPAGANSTTVASMSIDVGTSCAEVVVETTPGQGSRPVGMLNVAVDDQAGVYFAVREILGGVVHLTSSESHTGTTGSTNQTSFPWFHTTPPPKGVTVFVWTNGNSGLGTLSLGVTYDGVTVPAVPGGEANRATGEQGNMKVYHLGVSVPATSPAEVVVSRTSSPATMWACCCTQLAPGDTEVFTQTIAINAGSGGITEVVVDDASPGSNSLRYAGGHFGYDIVPPAGPNSVVLQDIDWISGTTALVVREIAPGQGPRLVGVENLSPDEKAIVHFAIREIVNVGNDLNVVVYGLMYPQSPIGELPGPGTPLARNLASTPEALHVGREVLSVWRWLKTSLLFIASPQHAQVTKYEAVLWTYPGEAEENRINLGVPTPDAFDQIVVDLATLYAGQPAGDYTVSIWTWTDTGDVNSGMSNAFTLPVA